MQASLWRVVLLPPARTKLLRAVAWNYYTIKSVEPSKLRKSFAYFYLFRTFRILWVYFKGSTRFYRLIIQRDSAVDIRGARRKYYD